MLDLPRETYELMRELSLAEYELEEAREENARIVAELSAHRAFMTGNFPSEMEEIVSLTARLTGTKNDDDDEPPLAPGDALRKRYEAKDRELTALRRRIRQRCHPDKTDDADLHETYELAEDAYERRDLEAMRELSRSVGSSRRYGRGTAAGERKRAKLKAIKAKVDELRQVTRLLRTSEAASEAKEVNDLIRQAGRDRAVAIIKRNLSAHVAQLKDQLAMKERRVRYVYSTTTFSTTSRS